MKRILILICLIGIVYAVGTLVVKQVSIFVNEASVLMSGINPTHVRKFVIDEFNKNILDESMHVATDAPVTLVRTHLNVDGDVDLIATVQSPQTCGTGGCIPTLLIKNDTGEFETVPFGYAVKSIEVEDSVTNGMHNLKINGDLKNEMMWDGKRYTLNNF